MIKKIIDLRKEEQGSAVLLMMLLLTVVLSLAGVVIDAGYVYTTQSHLQKTANAAVLSGGQELMNSEQAVNEVVGEVLQAHGESSSLQQTIIGSSSVEVELERPVPLFFSELFGMESVTLGADAKVEISPIGGVTGAVPLGVRDSTVLHYGETYTLKVDAGDSEGGNFGILALEGPGAKTYRQTLESGFDEMLKVGDEINTQTGNIAGPTRDAIDYRIDQCPNGTIYDRDCERIMIIVVYEPIGDESNFREVRITGFAYFYLQERMDPNDDSVQGTFIKRVGSGTPGEGIASDRGAYTLRLSQ